MTITFHNVLITIEAASAKEAYNQLCDRLSGENIEYTTDTFAVHGEEDDRSTEELFD